MCNKSRSVLYIGITNNLKRRIYEHKNELVEGFTRKYKAKHLVYFEEYKYVNEALRREKRLKNWHRDWKINLIKSINPLLKDLSEDQFRC